jgi:hypothetical protein
VDHRDAVGVRRRTTCDTRREAEDVLGRNVREQREGVRVDERVTLSEYAARWLATTAKRTWSDGAGARIAGHTGRAMVTARPKVSIGHTADRWNSAMR